MIDCQTLFTEKDNIMIQRRERKTIQMGFRITDTEKAKIKRLCKKYSCNQNELFELMLGKMK